jgi:hypothetical protein
MAKKTGVLAFVEEQRRHGLSDESIAHDLLEVGWPIDVVQHALHGKGDHSPDMSRRSKTTKLTLKDRLLHPASIFLIFIGILIIIIFQ